MSDQSWGPQGMPLAMALTAVAGFSLTPILTNELLKTGMPPEIISQPSDKRLDGYRPDCRVGDSSGQFLTLLMPTFLQLRVVD